MNLREFPVKPIFQLNSKKTADSKKKKVELKSSVLRPQCLCFDPSGEILAVGFTSGHIKLLRTDTFEDVASFAPTPDTIVCLKFNASGMYLAAYDSSHHVLLLKKALNENQLNFDDGKSETSGIGITTSMANSQDEGTFVYIGRAKAHKAPITGIEFGFKEGQDILLSIGEDR